MKNSVHVCISLLNFLRDVKHIPFKPQRSLDKTRLTSFQLLHSLHPPTFILPVSFHLCTDDQDCVYVYTSPAMLVYMYTFVFLLPPPLNYKVLECLSL